MSAQSSSCTISWPVRRARAVRTNSGVTAGEPSRRVASSGCASMACKTAMAALRVSACSLSNGSCAARHHNHYSVEHDTVCCLPCLTMALFKQQDPTL